VYGDGQGSVEKHPAYGVARTDALKHISLSALSCKEAAEALIVMHAIEVTLNNPVYMLEPAATQRPCHTFCTDMPAASDACASMGNE
jgi:hypothetical protein